MRMKLISRAEQAGNDKLQLTFVQMGSSDTLAGVQLSGWFDREYAMSFVVGQEYDLALTAV